MATTFNQSQNEEVQVMLKLENLLAAGDLVIQQQIKQLGQNLTSGSVQLGYRDRPGPECTWKDFLNF